MELTCQWRNSIENLKLAHTHTHIYTDTDTHIHIHTKLAHTDARTLYKRSQN